MKLKIRDKQTRPEISLNSGAIIALTGNIGTGKSFVMKEIKDLGYLTFNCDLEAKNVIKNSTEIKNYLTSEFPETIQNGEINFPALSDIAFKTPNLLKKLSSYSHQKLHVKQAEVIAQNPHQTILFEIPLLFENSREQYFDYVILTYSDQQTVAKRVLQRKGMTESKFHDILSRQVSVAPNDPRVDFCIDTSQSEEHTKAQLLKIFNGN